jgi:hypothetical protein
MWISLVGLFIHRVINRVIHKFEGSEVDACSGPGEAKNKVSDFGKVVEFEVDGLTDAETEVL